MQLTDQEKRIIEELRNLGGWGTLTIKVKGGRAVMISPTKDIKLDQEVIIMAGCKGKGKGMGMKGMPKSDKKDMGMGKVYGKKMK